MAARHSGSSIALAAALITLRRRAAERVEQLPRLARVHRLDALSLARACRTVRPVVASMSRSESRHGQPSPAARRRPTAVLPAPIRPTTTTWRGQAPVPSHGEAYVRRAAYTSAGGPNVDDSPPSILPPAVIGILGGGQLGRMLALAARAMGYRIWILDPDPDCPAAAMADRVVVGAYDDVDAALRLAAGAESSPTSWSTWRRMWSRRSPHAGPSGRASGR